ncbi:DNA helicase II [Candidatus Endomicrobiellum trichonymphae]|nr:DNA helicase II [Candidatus Endomicrobium trichonymphae]
MFEYNIKGLTLLNEKSGYKYNKNDKPIITDSAEKKDFKKHFFDNRNKIFSDKLAKFVFKANKSSNNEVINRITRIYSYIFIDEAQDLAGYDLDIIKLLLKKSSNIVLTADPRQVTYSTHRAVRNQKYKGGKIKDFLDENCKNLIKIDYTSLNVSHRNNQEICDYSSDLYPEFPKSNTCACCNNNNISHNGIFLLRKKDIEPYMHIYNNVIQLRWNRNVEMVKTYRVFNFGESKGKTFERVLIYPTTDMKKWIVDNKSTLTNEARAKFYVAITRAKYSVAIVVNDDDIDIKRAEERGISFEKIYDDVKREVQLYKLYKKNF